MTYEDVNIKYTDLLLSKYQFNGSFPHDDLKQEKSIQLTDGEKKLYTDKGLEWFPTLTGFMIHSGYFFDDEQRHYYKVTERGNRAKELKGHRNFQKHIKRESRQGLTNILLAMAALIGILSPFLLEIGKQNKWWFNEKQDSVEWTTESLDDKHVTWDGSWGNSKKLKLLYHGVKYYNENGGNEWAFKVTLAYTKNHSDDTLGTYARKKGLWTPPTDATLCMPVDKIVYGIYDSDDFLLDSMSVVGYCVKYTDTVTFQSKKKISKDLIMKSRYGKLNVEAGYYVKK